MYITMGFVCLRSSEDASHEKKKRKKRKRKKKDYQVASILRIMFVFFC